MKTIDDIREKVLLIVNIYPITKVILFGSRAAGNNRDDSDVDLIMEFSTQVSLFTLVAIRLELEDSIGLNVDIIHGPIRDDDIIEVKEMVELYAA